MTVIINLLINNLKVQSQYKLNFILLCIAIAPVHLIQMLFSLVIINKFGLFMEWGKWDLIFLYAMFMTSYSVAQVFFRQFRYLEKYIIRGELDCYYLRPQPIIFSIIFYNINVMEIFSQFIPSVILLLLACYKTLIYKSIKKLLILCISLLTGTIIISSLFILIGSASFWLISSSQLEDIFYAFKDFMNYPIKIYGKRIILFLSYGLPLAFVNYYPVSYLLEKDSTSIWLIFVGIIIAIILLFLTILIWSRCIKHYESSGN